MNYSPGPVPQQYDPRFLREELNRLRAAIDAVADGFAPVVYAPPTKPREGMLRNADGTHWNPGSGGGLYRYDGTTWRFLG